MKILSAAFSLFVAVTAVHAQPAGWTEVPSRLTVGVGSSREFAKPTFDAETEDYVAFVLNSDCNMRVAAKVFLAESELKYHVILNNIYGGCRAGGSVSGHVVFEKLKREYRLNVVEVEVDRMHGRPGKGFQFPKQPSTKSRETLSVREIDLSGCLELTGQSQWIIQDAARLTESVIEGFETEACRGHIEDVAIDFESETLAGYSFASGYCQRPSGLDLSVVKETSSDPRENRFIIQARHDSPGQDYCKDWRTYGIWLVIPKPPEGYRVEFMSGVKDQPT